MARDVTIAQRLDGIDRIDKCGGCGLQKEVMANGFCASCQDHPSLRPAPTPEPESVKEPETTGFFKRSRKK